MPTTAGILVWRSRRRQGYALARLVDPRQIYLYLKFVDKVGSCVPLTAQAVRNGCAILYHINFGDAPQIARIGLNYKLDWLGPVVAKC